MKSETILVRSVVSSPSLWWVSRWWRVATRRKRIRRRAGAPERDRSSGRSSFIVSPGSGRESRPSRAPFKA